MSNGSPGLDPRAAASGQEAFEIRFMPQRAGAPGVRTVTDDVKQVTRVRLQSVPSGNIGTLCGKEGASSEHQCRRRKRIPHVSLHALLPWRSEVLRDLRR